MGGIRRQRVRLGTRLRSLQDHRDQRPRQPGRVSRAAGGQPDRGALVATDRIWIETHRKRPVMIAMDVRFAAMATIPIAFWSGWLSYP